MMFMTFGAMGGEEHYRGQDTKECKVELEVGENRIGEHALGERMVKAHGDKGDNVKRTCAVCWCGTTVYTPSVLSELNNTQLVENRTRVDFHAGFQDARAEPAGHQKE